MGNRTAVLSQADVARVIRACRRAGLSVVRAVVRADMVDVETAGTAGDNSAIQAETSKETVL